MIVIEKTEVVGWEHAIRGMRNPMNSWDKSDTIYGTYWGDIGNHKCIDSDGFTLGDNDHNLMMKLSKAGTDHSKFLRMIVVYCDITAPMYWWKEFDTYKVGTVRNSCSTMHKIHSKGLTLDDFSHEHLFPMAEVNLNETIKYINSVLPEYRFNSSKLLWWQMIQLLPSSYNQRSTVMMNYQVLKNIYHSRKNHKLDEWKEFCKWIETLPYSELITGGDSNE